MTERWDVTGRYAHPHWLAFLCTALAAQGVTVQDGHAVRRDDGSWSGHLDVEAGRDVPDLAALAATPPTDRDTTLVLTGAELARRGDGLLVVEVTAADELGFLGRLLRRVAVLTLLPVEVVVATRAGVAEDRLVLSGIGGRAPSGDVEQALARVLAGLRAA